MRGRLLALVVGTAAASTSSGVETKSAVVYARVGGVELQMDYARPDGGADLPVLIFIHGGGWKEGSRAAYAGEINQAAERGYFAATISHRLTADTDPNGKPLYPWPAAIHDCKAAVRHLRVNAEVYGVDPDRIAATGASSGGHLALMLAATASSDGLEGDVEPVGVEPGQRVPSRIAAAISFAGPTDMVSCYDAPIVRPYAETLLGGNPIDRPHAYATASPVRYLSIDDPPFMLIHGEQDSVVPVGQSRLMRAESNRLGRVRDRWLFLEGEPHALGVEANRRAWESAYRFLDDALHDPNEL